jgi:hypothetical protein
MAEVREGGGVGEAVQCIRTRQMEAPETWVTMDGSRNEMEIYAPIKDERSQMVETGNERASDRHRAVNSTCSAFSHEWVCTKAPHRTRHNKQLPSRHATCTWLRLIDEQCNIQF